MAKPTKTGWYSSVEFRSPKQQADGSDTWSKELPTKTGWYWHRRSIRHSCHLWCCYFFDGETGDNGEWWQDGTHVPAPVGGWFHEIPEPKM